MQYVSAVVQWLSRVQLFVTTWTVACQASLSFTISRVCSNSCPLSQRYHPTISSSVIHFSSCLQFFPASGSFLMSPFFASGGQNTGTSISTSVLPMNIRGWFLLGLTDLISWRAKGLSRVFSSKLFKGIHSSAFSLFYCQPLTSAHATGIKQHWPYRILSAKSCPCFLICCLGLLFFFQGTSIF